MQQGPTPSPSPASTKMASSGRRHRPSVVTTSWSWRKRPIRRTRGCSNFSKAARPRRRNLHRGAAGRDAAFQQCWAGPNRDTHTIKIRATDQRHTARLTAGKTQGCRARFCSIPKDKRCHPVPRRSLCHPGSATACTVQKKRFTAPLPRRCHGYWLRPPGRRIRPAILE